MKRFFLLAFGLMPVLAQAASFSEAFAEDKACMVRHAYAQSAAPTASPELLASVTQACVTFAQGSGAWYAAQRAATSAGFDAQRDYEQAQLRSFRATARVYFEQALAACASLSEEDCLRRLSQPRERRR